MNQDILIRNNVKIRGKGTQPIIFVPGFGCDQNIWRLVAPFFENDYQVILFDHVGSGQSDVKAYCTTKYNNLHGYSQDVLEICEVLNLHNAILVGHSVGSIISMLASIKKPTYFERLVMIGPSPCYLNDPPKYEDTEKVQKDNKSDCENGFPFPQSLSLSFLYSKIRKTY